MKREKEKGICVEQNNEIKIDIFFARFLFLLSFPELISKNSIGS